MPCADARHNVIQNMLWTDHWFYGCSALTRMDGVSTLWEMAQLRHALNSCSALESIDLRGFKASALANLAPAKGIAGMGVSYGCKEIVGDARTVCDASKTGHAMMFWTLRGHRDT